MANAERFIQDGGIALGIVKAPFDVSQPLPMNSLRCKNRSLTELLIRLAYALALALTEEIFIDRVILRPELT